MPPSSRRQKLIQERNAKRNRCTEIFREKQLLEAKKKTLDDEFAAIQNELLVLDERIEASPLEEEEERYSDADGKPQPIPQQRQSIPHENEGGRGSNIALTMHPEEILSDEERSPPLVPPFAAAPAFAAAPSANRTTDVRKMAPPNRKRTSSLLAPLYVRHHNSSATSSTSVSSLCPFTKEQIVHVLQSAFHIQNFREKQLEIIQTTLSNQDAFVIMRTGGGKSLCYQLPAVLERQQKKVTLVVSPLLSLIQDQEQQMNQFVPGSCVSFTSGMGTAEHTDTWRRVRDPQQGVCMIIVTPEKVHKSGKLKSELEKLDRQGRLARFVIDEAHCACQWGHDFRPDYAKLGQLRGQFPHIPILAVTATASAKVQQDCINILGMSRNFKFYQSSANRPNLTYQVRPKLSSSQVIDDMVDFIQTNHKKSAGIIYTYSRKDADTVAEQLREQGIESESYHSDVSVSLKNRIHHSWMHNVTQVVVATIAFGLGINKPDVRFVLHHSLSKSLEAYYQESGRAGRDGLPADCILYYSPKDIPRLIRLIDKGNLSLFMNHMVLYAERYGSDRLCRAMLMQHLGDNTTQGNVDLIVSSPEEQASNEFVRTRNVASHAKTVLQLLSLKQYDNLTLPMLVKEWRANPAEKCVQDNPPGKDLSVTDCEHIVVALLVQGFIKKISKKTKYGVVVYLHCSPKAQSFISSDRNLWTVRLPKKTARKRKSEDSTIGTVSTTKKGASGTISVAAASNRKRAPSAKRKRTVRKRKLAPRKKAATKRSTVLSVRNARRKSAPAALAPLNIPNAAPEVIELDDDSSLSEVGIDDDDSDVQEVLARKASLRHRQPQGRGNSDMQQDPFQWDDDYNDSDSVSDSEDDSDEENEFDG